MLSNLNRIMTIASLALLSVSGTAQTANWNEWETLQPEPEEFTVLMPKNSSTERATFPYHKVEITARMYFASTPNGPVLAVASFNGIKSNPALYTDFQRFNSYVDAFKTWFPSKVRPKETVVKLTQVGNNTYHGYAGREYRMSLGDLNGTVFAYATKKRFYTIVSLNTKKDDELQQKFLSSFYLPEKPPETTAANQPGTDQVMPETSPTDPKATETTQPAAGTTPNSSATENSSDTPANPQTAPNNQAQNQTASDNPAQPPGGRAPVSGGVLNGRAIYLPQPQLPTGDAPTGTVMVQVLIDEQGSVMTARAISGPQALHIAAVNAARLARFTQTLLMGEPVKVSGTLVYNFVRSN